MQTYKISERYGSTPCFNSWQTAEIPPRYLETRKSVYPLKEESVQDLEGRFLKKGAFPSVWADLKSAVDLVFVSASTTGLSVAAKATVWPKYSMAVAST